MDDLQLLKRLNNRIGNIYNRQHLFPLRGVDVSYTLPSKRQFVSWLHDNIQRNTDEIINIIDDFCSLSDEIVYFTALLYLYQPYINSPIKDAIDIGGGKMAYPEYQTIEGKRYDMFAGILYEKVFSFWDRIGNLIAIFFPDKFSEKENIYFTSVMRKLEVDYASNNDFQWLLNFRENQHKVMNNSRKNHVHNRTILTDNFNKQRLNNLFDYEKTKALHENRLQYTSYFKEMNGLCIEGFDKTLDFLDYIIKNAQNF